jgi:GTP-binding protein
MYGASGDNLTLKVPPGTMIRDRESGVLLGDLTKEGDEVIVAHGGRGGKGNKHFASSTNRAPRFAQPGEPGEERWLKIELKIMADIGLVGFPNAGKSTLISRLSAAKPKVADYPFTTLKPSLGVVKVSIDESFVMADIPGIIEGAHEGAGLGLRFLRHIERTRLLLLLVDPTDPNRDAQDCYHILRKELDAFSKKLGRKPFAVAITKSDIEPDEEREEKVAALIEELQTHEIPFFRISSVTGDNIETIRFGLHDLLKQHPRDWYVEPIDDEDDVDEVEQGAGQPEEPTDPLDMI